MHCTTRDQLVTVGKRIRLRRDQLEPEELRRLREVYRIRRDCHLIDPRKPDV